jgi:hypothetical protein
MAFSNTHATPTVNVSSSGTCLYAIGFANTRLAQPVRVEGWKAMAAEPKVYSADHTSMTILGVLASSHRRLMSQSWVICHIVVEMH